MSNYSKNQTLSKDEIKVVEKIILDIKKVEAKVDEVSFRKNLFSP